MGPFERIESKMDCTAAKSHLLDELYEELDVDTSLELAEHLAGCAACSEELRALQAFRTDFPVPALEIPAGLTERIMARVDEASAKLPAPAPLALVSSSSSRPPWMRSLAPVISRAGAWAMRPQTAMAAVFVLMVGSSAWLLGRGQLAPESEMASQAFEQGAPVVSPSSAAPADFDPEAARAAHGLAGGPTRAAAPLGAVAQAAPPPPAAPAGDSLAYDRKGKAASAEADDYAPAAEPEARKDYARAELAEKKAESGPAESGAGRLESSSASTAGSGGFASAMQLYRASKWDEATQAFEVLARQGDSNAALWAAFSVREGHGCRTALTRFDHLAGTALGTPAGNDATLEGGLCYRRLGLIDSSTQRFQRLLAYDGYSARARSEIEANHRILVARKDAQNAAAAAAGGGGTASPRSAPAKPSTKPAERSGFE